MRAGWGLLALASIGCKDKNGDLEMKDENNFIYAATIDLGDIELQSGANATVNWGAMDTDIRGRTMDPTLVERVYAIEFIGFTKEELTTKIEKNELFQSDSGEQYLWDNGANATTMEMTDLAVLGNDFDETVSFVENSDRVWLLSLVNVVNDTNDVLQSKFLTPLVASANTTVDLTNDCTTLEVEVDMTSPPPVTVSAGATEWRADWSTLTTDVNGHAFEPVLASQLQIARFDAASVADVEDVFLQLDTEAEEFYRLDVLGSTGADDLTEAVDPATGNNFGGFTTDGVWIVALGCPTCLSPAPLYLAVVDVQ